MTIPLRLQSHLEEQGALRGLRLPRSRISAPTARAAHVPAHELATSVAVEDDDGRVMAVRPADRKVRLGELPRPLARRNLRLAGASRMVEPFTGCDQVRRVTADPEPSSNAQSESPHSSVRSKGEYQLASGVACGAGGFRRLWI